MTKMKTHRKNLRVRWESIANSLMLALALVVLAPQIQAWKLKSYTLPIYPGELNRARLVGNVKVKVSVADGKVDEIKIMESVSQDLRTGERLKGVKSFEKCVKDAVSRWEFNIKEAEIEVEVVFRLSDEHTEAVRARYKYTIEEKDFLPSKIVVEADKWGPDSFVDPGN